MDTGCSRVSTSGVTFALPPLCLLLLDRHQSISELSVSDVPRLNIVAEERMRRVHYRCPCWIVACSLMKFWQSLYFEMIFGHMHVV